MRLGPLESIRDALEDGRPFSVAFARPLATRAPACSITLRDGAFTVRDGAGRHAGTFASWEATADAALRLARRSDA